MSWHSSVAAGSPPIAVVRRAALARVVGICAALVAVSACGQKGPLTLPKGAAASAPASTPSR